MRYVDFEKGCGPSELVVKECEGLSLAPGKVKVDVKAFGVNRADTLQRQGNYPPPPGESDILGLDLKPQKHTIPTQTKNLAKSEIFCLKLSVYYFNST